MPFDFEAKRQAENARVPELEHLEGYVLNLRFFVQNSESTSLKNSDCILDNDEETGTRQTASTAPASLWWNVSSRKANVILQFVDGLRGEVHVTC